MAVPNVAIAWTERGVVPDMPLMGTEMFRIGSVETVVTRRTRNLAHRMGCSGDRALRSEGVALVKASTFAVGGQLT